MSSFDDNLAEIRETEAEVEASTSTTISTSKPSDAESQPLLAPTVAQPESQSELEDSSPEPANNPPTNQNQQQSNRSSSMSSTLFFTLSTIYGASSVMLGAFGAHGLKKRISDPSRITNWSTAAQYQLVHSVALLATSLTLPARAQRVPATLFLAGMTMFSGSIYLLVLDPQRFKALGPVTPIGGLCLIGGWIGLGIVGRRFVPLR